MKAYQEGAKPAQALPESPPPSISESNPGKCHLLKLPAELREAIFSLVVQQDHIIRYWPPSVFPYSLPSLACTCRQIREESQTLYFKGNSFKFTFGRTLPAIPAGIEHMREVRIKFMAHYHVHSFGLALKKGFDRYEVGLGPTAFNILPDVERVEVLEQVRAWLECHSTSGHTGLSKTAFKELLCFIQERVYAKFSET